jgi:hypothetical protein
MAQTRLFNFGDLATAERIGYMLDAEYIAQIIDGFDMTVTDVDEVTISAGKAFVVGVPTGLADPTARIIIEDATETFHIVNTAAAKNYTILYLHEDVQISGGTAALLTVVEDLYTSYQNGVILGWLVYPGGGVPLEDHMLYHAPKLDKTDHILGHWEGADIRHPPFFGLHEVAVDGWITVTVEDSGSGYLWYKLDCNPLAIGVVQAQYITQHSVHSMAGVPGPPHQMLVALQIPNVVNTELNVDVNDSLGAVYESETFSNLPVYADQVWRMPRDNTLVTWTEDGVFTVTWTFDMQAGDTIYWGRFAVSERDLPFDPGYTNAGP